ncbi:tryptophan synthase subunit beta [Mycoplasma sp. P36-A1]|uniref:tryptophan synthase subunit beta n=1 Tax=Mycoplasma sp. P36-A1 TaxID=3252900 RepID=UPI003C2EF051
METKINAITEKNFNGFGDAYVPDVMIPILDELTEKFNEYCTTEAFSKEYLGLLKDYVGRPSSLYYAKNFSKYINGPKVYLKREDLNHTGAHKINNAIGQALLAKYMNKDHLIAETGAGQHGVATATVAALFDMKCTVFMGAEDVARQSPNVKRMEMLGATVVPVTRGLATLKEAVDVALEYYIEHIDEVFYLLGSAVGPAPYPQMVREFQKIIGEEAKAQILEKEGVLPDALIASVGGGSNAIGLFYDFLNDESVKIYGVEGAGMGIETGKHASAFAKDKIAIIHGMKTYVFTDDNDQPMPAYSISAGLDYPGVGPEHASLKESQRVTYDSVTDKEALDAFYLLCKTEGIIPALESSHALAYIIKTAANYTKDQIVIVNLSGRGDKDLDQIFNLAL